MKIYKKKKKDKGVPVFYMNDGDIAVIKEWDGEKFTGRIVQRFGDNLISLGKPNGNSWSTVLNKLDESLRVRILPKGTLLEI